MGLQVVRPISLDNGILDITNGEESRVETGSLSNGLTYATLTYITDQDDLSLLLGFDTLA